MRRRSFLSTIPLAFIGLTARAGAASELRIVGSGDGMEMVQTLAQEYMAAHPGKTIIVPPSIGTGGGFTAVSTEKEILGRIARAPTAEEAAQGLVATPLVHVPIAIFTHPSTGVKALTGQQVLGIFSGKILNWKEVGGNDERIRVVVRDQNDATTMAMRNRMPGWKDLVFLERSKQTLSTTEMLESVRSTQGAIGYCPYAKPLEAAVHYIAVDGVGPTDQGWAVSVLLSLLHKTSTVNSDALAFLAFAKTARGQAVLKASGGRVD